MAPKTLKKIKPLTNMETGIILSEKPWYERLFEIITRTSMPEHIYNDVKQEFQAKEVIDLSTSHHNVFKSGRIRAAIVNFLEKGVF